MSGNAKRKYEAENIRIAKSMTTQLNFIYEILPKEYDSKILLDYYKKYYPNEWKIIEERCKIYKQKNDFLLGHGKKGRYNISTPESFFFGLPKVKYILCNGSKVNHRASYVDGERDEKLNAFEVKRQKAIEKRKQKIDQYTKNQQHIDPLFIDLFDYSYHRKGVTQEEKLEIVSELFKYDTPKVVTLLQKINDAERNDQIRGMVFKHLQSSGHYVKLRKKFKGKKKTYYIETFDYNMSPSDLAIRLEKNRLQDKKRYDMFISHSAKDAAIVRDLIKYLNEQKLTCYCDWMSDSDFLKRNLVSDCTKEVLKRRIEQSNAVLFLKTDNSIIDGHVSSEWIQMEIDYSKELDKKIFITDCTVENKAFEYHENIEEI